MKKSNYHVQWIVSLLLGGGIFYFVAPHSSQIGVFILVPIIILISSVVSCLVTTLALKLVLGKATKVLKSNYFISLISILAIVFIYPPPQRYVAASSGIYEDGEKRLDELGLSEEVNIKILKRKRMVLDVVREHKWRVLISNKSGTINKTVIYYESCWSHSFDKDSSLDWSDFER